MTDCILKVGNIFWLPVVFWVALFFWSRYLAYPIALKGMIRNGKTWLYVPMWWSKHTAKQKAITGTFYLLCALAALTSASTVYWLLPSTVYWFLILVILFCVGARFGVRYAFKRIPRLEIDCYFFEYHRQVYQYQCKGEPLVEEDIRNQCIWAFQHDLRHADSKGRFFTYIKAMAASRKIPKDLDAEVSDGV
jgi:hypothetical protein